MSRLILPNQQQIPSAGDVQMGAENGVVVLRQCLVITQAFPPDEAEKFAQGMLRSVELARLQATAAQLLMDGSGVNGPTEKMG